MLGTDVMEVFKASSPVGFTKADLDIADEDAVLSALQGFDVVINAAAYTRVDDAETQKNLAFAVNAEGPQNIAHACARYGQRMIHVSTDYVFDGQASSPYSSHHPARPQSVYGASKAEGEERVREILPDSSLIVRTAWLYGQSGPNFVTTMLKLSKDRDTVQVVDDQIGQPTWSQDLAQMINNLVMSDIQSGVFHGTNAGQTSWWGFARAIFTAAGLDPERVLATTSADFVRPAPRPAWSVLDHADWAANGLPTPRTWEDAFAEAWNTVFEVHKSNLLKDSGS
jgi:dTDP-4-dehydrorhamnose reductase